MSIDPMVNVASLTEVEAEEGPNASAGPANLQSPLRAALRSTLTRPLVVVSVAWLALVVVTSLLASLIQPYSPLAQNLLAPFQGPSSAHLLGTDDLGRDVLSRLLHGGGALMLTSLESVAIAVLIGVPLGLLAGYRGGLVDSVSSFAINVLISIPGFVILVGVVVVSNNKLTVVMGVLGVLFSANLFRLIRATTLATRSLPFVDAARVNGLSRRRILTRHILPNITGPLVVQVFLTFSLAIIIATSLAFLGLGLSPQTPSWGQMVFDATQYLRQDAWLMVPVGAVIIFTILAVNFIGSALRDSLGFTQRQRLLVDPRAFPKRVDPRPLPRESSAVVSKSPRGSAPVSGAPGRAMPADGAMLTVEDLTVGFPDGDHDQPVVDGVSFSIEKGRALGLVGESGCGKTITALAMLGLVPAPGRVLRGQVLLGGEEVTALPEKGWAKRRGSTISLVSQEPMVALDPCFTIGSQLREPLRQHRGLSRREASLEALSLLQLVGIHRAESVAKSYPHQLSGGMAQRVGIALALTGEPDVLIADEPTTALDVTIQAEILDLLRGLQKQLGMTIVLVTHDLGVVADICDTVAVMYAGQVVETGAVEDVLVNPSHPYTRGLLGATPDLAVSGEPLPTVEGTVPLPADWPTWCRFADRCPVALASCRVGPVALEEVAPGKAARCIRARELLEVSS
jgi:peptide/nickel transport system permease protein